MDYTIDTLPSRLTLGGQTETGVNDIRIDMSEWLRQWPELAISIWPTRPGEKAAYPADTYMDGSAIIWRVNNADTAIAGSGTVQIMGVAEGQKKLSKVINTYIASTTTGVTTDPPEAAKPWADGVAASAASAQQAAQRAEDAAGEIKGISAVAQTLKAGEAATAEYADGVVGFGIPEGERGIAGEPGPKGDTGAPGTDGTTPHIGKNGNWYIGDTDTGVSAEGASRIFKVTVVTGPGGPDTLSANKTFAEIKSAYSSGSMVVAQHGSSLYELTYVGNTKVEFTHVNETYCDVLSCTNSGDPQEIDGWLLNRAKRINYDTKYGDIGQKTVPVAIKELQDKSAPTVTDSDAGKYLHVNASTKKLEWAEVESGGGSELPAVTAADAGKFLRVSSSGSWVAETVANANGGEF